MSGLREINSALLRLEAEIEGSEAQGVLVGMCCALGKVSVAEWIERIAPGVESGDLLAKEALETLAALHARTVRELSDAVLDFQPLLPDDETALSLRVSALGEWCQGFLLGISHAGAERLKELPADSAEAVGDLVKMARAGEYELEGGEADESAYAELVEFVRTAVLMINEEMNPTQAPPQTDRVLH